MFLGPQHPPPASWSSSSLLPAAFPPTLQDEPPGLACIPVAEHRCRVEPHQRYIKGDVPGSLGKCKLLGRSHRQKYWGNGRENFGREALIKKEIISVTPFFSAFPKLWLTHPGTQSRIASLFIVPRNGTRVCS